MKIFVYLFVIGTISHVTDARAFGAPGKIFIFREKGHCRVLSSRSDILEGTYGSRVLITRIIRRRV